MPVMNNKLPTVQGRVSQRPRVVRSVRVHAASPVEEPDKPQGLQAYFTDGLRSVFQTERAADLQWKGNSFVGKIEHDDHKRRMNDAVAASKAPTRFPLLSLPAPAEMTETFKQYVVGMLSKAANSKDADTVEPEWKINEFEGRIQHKHNDRH